MSNPYEILERLKEGESTMADINKRLETLKVSMEDNGYTGKYRPLFGEFYGDILEAKARIINAFSDGFQLGDLEEIFVVAAPILKKIYTKAIPLLKAPDEAEAFLRDLIIFIYYEIEPLIKSWGFMKFFFRIALRLWIAAKLAKYMKSGFDWADGKITSVAIVAKAKKFLDAVVE